MLTEKRIQVYLPEKDYKSIKHRAQSEGKSIAQVLREAASQYLSPVSNSHARSNEAPPPAERPNAVPDVKRDAIIVPRPTVHQVDEPDDEWRAWQGLRVK